MDMSSVYFKCFCGSFVMYAVSVTQKGNLLKSSFGGDKDILPNRIHGCFQSVLFWPLTNET